MSDNELPKLIELFPLLQQKGEVGIEIEMEGEKLRPTRSRCHEFWRLKSDGSLRGQACEYVLKNPVPRKDIETALSILIKSCPNAQFNPSDRCGVHIHINVQELTLPQIINFAVLYLSLEGLLLKYCGEDREGNFFCLRASDAEFLIDRLVQARKYSDLQILFGDEIRYASMNLGAIGKFGSIEFRSFRTPKDLMYIKPWAEMLLKIKDKSLEFQEPWDIIEGISKDGEYMFLRHIMEEYAGDLICDNYSENLMNGVRTVQDVAYVQVHRPPLTKAELENDMRENARRAGAPLPLEVEPDNEVMEIIPEED